MALDRNIWRSRISVGTKLRLYNCCILPIFLCGAETWVVTATAAKTFDAVDQWCLRRILNIHWTERITNNEVRSRTQPLLSDAVRSRRVRFFGHICIADPSPDYSRALYALYATILVCPSSGGKTRPADTDLVTNSTIENDLRPLNLSRRAQNRTAWQTFKRPPPGACQRRSRGNGYVADKLR